ncbi:MFS transporter [Pseudorhodoferax sp.]|uniref:MFS transporter n=1 Tax=Pseudorhodoferax sp. TaxID=1993553 RepID=UPI002DD69CF7|nr:MFS transporter [Pseudorhodoferax sp.]
MTPTGGVPQAARAWLVPCLMFAAAYFLAALLRAVTATLAPAFSAEFALGAADLGLLAGAYFLGFSMLQLPLGVALDRFGPRRVELSLVVLAVLGCMLFAAAGGFAQLVLARALIGMGVAACLMAPLTFFQQRLSISAQLRANSWMLMTGSLGMVASTAPVQWLLPLWGWRGLFWALAALLALALLGLALGVPRDQPPGRQPAAPPGPDEPSPQAGDGVPRYAVIVRSARFIRVAPLGFVLYGGMVAMQALWAGPWLTEVSGWSAQAASKGLLLINLGMLLAFLSWGSVMPGLTRRGVAVDRLLVWGVPVSLGLLALNIGLGPRATAVHWAAWCMATSVVALSQPALAQAFPVQMAGRALSAYNLAVFLGVFVLQWGMGAAIDSLRALGLAAVPAFQATLGGFWLLSALCYGWFVLAPRWLAHNRPSSVLP